MAGIFTKMLQQAAAYWAPDIEGGHGESIFLPVVMIKCRWEDTLEMYRDRTGRERVSNALIYVDRDVKIGGVLRKLTIKPYALTELVSQTDPYANEGAYEIEKFMSMPDLKVKNFLRTAVV